MKYFQCLCCTLLLLLSGIANAKEGLEFSVGLGNAYSEDESLTLRRRHSEDINMEQVSFSTRPFQAPWYYNIRLASWKHNKAYEIELIHHKLYASSGLSNSVDAFEATDGYNLLYVNRAIHIKGGITARLGIGTVIARPDITINGVHYRENYQLSGAAAQLGIEKEWGINSHWAISVEAKVSHAYASLKVADGTLYVPNQALHFIMAIKYH